MKKKTTKKAEQLIALRERERILVFVVKAAPIAGTIITFVKGFDSKPMESILDVCFH